MSNQSALWEQIYSQGDMLNRAPYDAVVSFLGRHTPKDRPRHDMHILELGCGAGNNLRFAAHEGYAVTGIDISQIAIEYAKDQFENEGLNGEFLVGDFSTIAKINKKFDFIIERGALTCVPLQQAKDVIDLLPPIMKRDAQMLFCPYSDRHSLFASGKHAENGMTLNSTGLGYDSLYFYNKREIHELFKGGFIIESLVHSEKTEMIAGTYHTTAEWIVVVKKMVTQ